jgi:hypothetical protein
LSDIALGGNLFRLPASRVAERIELHPWVEAARVVRVLPDTVRIVIYERRPLAAINSQFDGQVYGIDPHRVLLPDLARHTPDSATGAACFDLPILTGSRRSRFFRQSVERRADPPGDRDPCFYFKRSSRN